MPLVFLDYLPKYNIGNVQGKMNSHKPQPTKVLVTNLDKTVKGQLGNFSKLLTNTIAKDPLFIKATAGVPLLAPAYKAAIAKFGGKYKLAIEYEPKGMYAMVRFITYNQKVV